jgi:hypothetical protein
MRGIIWARLGLAEKLLELFKEIGGLMCVHYKLKKSKILNGSSSFVVKFFFINFISGSVKKTVADHSSNKKRKEFWQCLGTGAFP